MRATKDLARQQVDVFGQLLLERAVISDITPLEKRGVQYYSFDVLDDKYDYPVECEGVQELARVLTAMWSAYQKAWNLLI